MATDAQLAASRRGGGRVMSVALIDLVVAGTGTVKAQFDLPQGATFVGADIETPVAISGSPTTCNVRVGTADAGQQVIADVDAKAQGHILATIVAAFNKVNPAPTALATLFLQVVTSGGTAPAGTITVALRYAAANG